MGPILLLHQPLMQEVKWYWSIIWSPYSLGMWLCIKIHPSDYIVTVNYYMTRVSRKQTLRYLSLSYQKKDAMTPTFREYDLWSQNTQIIKSRCHTKRRMGSAKRAHPSFGIPMTKTLRSVFSWHVSYWHVLFLGLSAAQVKWCKNFHFVQWPFKYPTVICTWP